MNYKKIIIAFCAIAVFQTSCTKTFLNPNAPDLSAVLTTPEGLLSYIVGTKQTWATSVRYYETICGGQNTHEVLVLNNGNADLAALYNGGTNVGGGNALVRAFWSSLNTVRANGQILIDNSKTVLNPQVQATVNAYGNYFKAMAIATIAEYWENVPATVISSTDYLQGQRVSFKDRNTMLDEAIGNLTNAASTLSTTPVTATNASLVASNLGFDIDLPNAIQALLARIYTVRGKSAEALAAANKVDLTSKSVWKYDDANRNPLYNDVSTNNVSGGNPINFAIPTGLTQVDSTDGRLAFYLGSSRVSRVAGFALATTTSVPVYLPGEITLIKAEAYARTNDLTNATAELNKILTKTADPFGVTAKGKAYAGAATQAAILTEIYRQRCIELYLSGQRLEDVRRFGRPILNDANSESTRKFYPYPNVERDDNPNTPVDPAG